jgi:hypothetical protein
VGGIGVIVLVGETVAVNVGNGGWVAVGVGVGEIPSEDTALQLNNKTHKKE